MRKNVTIYKISLSRLLLSLTWLDFCKTRFLDLLRPWLWRYTTQIWIGALICSRPEVIHCSPFHKMCTQPGNDAFVPPHVYSHFLKISREIQTCLHVLRSDWSQHTARVTCAWPNPPPPHGAVRLFESSSPLPEALPCLCVSEKPFCHTSTW